LADHERESTAAGPAGCLALRRPHVSCRFQAKASANRPFYIQHRQTRLTVCRIHGTSFSHTAGVVRDGCRCSQVQATSQYRSRIRFFVSVSSARDKCFLFKSKLFRCYVGCRCSAHWVCNLLYLYTARCLKLWIVTHWRLIILL
jgi:hypothetical protein